MTIPITYVRSSSYTCHNMCEMKFFSEYTLGWNGPSNKAADRGTIVHKVMEILAGIQLAAQNGEDSFTDENTEYTTSIQGSDLSDLDIDDIVSTCYYYYTKAFSHHDWEEKDWTICKKLTHKALDYREGYFDPRNQKILQPEQHFDVPLNFDWAKYEFEIDGETITGQLRLKGTIDLIVELDSNTIEIIDYKTGRKVDWATGEEITYHNLQKNFQLRQYHLASTILYPQYEHILSTIYYVNHNAPFTLSFGRSDIPETLEMIKTKFERIKNTKIPELTRSWKCRRFCHQGTSTFEETGVVPLIQTETGDYLTKQGETMTKCDQLKYLFKYRPIELIIEHMSKEDYSVTNYKAPGEIE